MDWRCYLHLRWHYSDSFVDTIEVLSFVSFINEMFLSFISFVDMRTVVAANRHFVKALAGRKINKKGDRSALKEFQLGGNLYILEILFRYVSDLFYMAPIYHQAFTKLEKLLVIDSTDLTIVSDIKVKTRVDVLDEN